jgi:hypothetical protein
MEGAAEAAVARRDDEASSFIFDSCALSVAEDAAEGSSSVRDMTWTEESWLLCAIHT